MIATHPSSSPGSPVQFYGGEPLPRQELMNITPELAARWLADCNSRNRAIRPAHVDNMVSDIKAGRWELIHGGIAFSPNNVLLDGQHRLQAIVQAGQPVRMYVCFNLSPRALLGIDKGMLRNNADSLNLYGSCGRVNDHQLAVLKTMLGKRGCARALTPGQTQAGFLQHREALEFALAQVPRRTRIPGIANRITRAVVARAWYSADRARLAAFCKVLTTGLSTSVDDRPAQMLFEYLIHNSKGSKGDKRYGKAQRALWAYLRGEMLTKLCAASGELFPLPEEMKR